MVEVDLNHIYKKYEGNDKYSVNDFDLHIKDKEFIVFVGPSGCGKSTTLRMVAGLEDISKGTLEIDHKVMNDVAPKDRDIAMVFQNYALYPHMSIYDNMAFGLKLRHYKKDEIDKRVKHAADILGLSEYLDKKPAELSGGQRQRVALGRAIVRDAPIFLMDEPLSNLDAKLRVTMRAEIAKLHQNLGTTTIYVTHDQTEAMTLADRVVVMSVGKVQQIGTPLEVYNTPVNMFVAGFIGSPQMNFFNVHFKGNRNALYPHMSIYDNMAFGLKLRHYKKDEIDKRVKHAADILGLSEYLDKKPAELSGGQRQRVALGRAIVRDAPIFLMDEPLSNLDAKLRVTMRAEIAKLHQNLGTTTIYVTHDQTEAMTLADRVVVMSVGKVQQIGTPLEVYNTPVNMFVAGFIGSPQMNFFNVHFKGNRISDGKGLDIEIPEGKAKMLKEKGYDDKDLVFGIRPEDIHSEEAFLETWPNQIVESTVVVSELLGSTIQLYQKVDGTEFVAIVNARDYHTPGDKVRMGFDVNKAHFFDKDTTNAIR